MFSYPNGAYAVVSQTLAAFEHHQTVKVTGTKEQDKMYYRHTLAGFPGGLKSTNLAKLRARHPEDIILNAVRRMLPRSALGRQMMTKLKVYAGDTHPHAAQKPATREVEA